MTRKERRAEYRKVIREQAVRSGRCAVCGVYKDVSGPCKYAACPTVKI